MTDPVTDRLSRLVVAAAVVDSLAVPSAMLCAARSYPPEHAGRFELPGGKVEPGETPIRALARELAEELDLHVTLGAEVRPTPGLAVAAPKSSSGGGPREFPDDDAPAWPAMHGHRMRVWLAEPADASHGPRRSGAHESLRWTPWDDLEALPWLPADLPILAAVRAAAIPPVQNPTSS